METIWKAVELTEDFGDRQCIAYMVNQLKHMGAPTTRILVDFTDCTLIDNSLVFVLTALKELNADCTGLSDRDMINKERFMNYEFYRIPYAEFRGLLNLKAGEIILLSDDLFSVKENSRVAKIERVESDAIVVTEYYKAHFRLDSKKLITHTQVYAFHSMFMEEPYIHRPTDKERGFIDEVFRVHKVVDYKFVC